MSGTYSTWLSYRPIDEEHARVLDRIRRWLGDNRLLPYNPRDWDRRVFEPMEVEQEAS